MAILTVEQLRLHVTSDLSDAALQMLLDAAEEAINAFLGAGAGTYDAPDAVNELITVQGDLIRLSQPAESIESVIEGTTLLAADDYELRSSGLTLRRLNTGTNPAQWWRRRVDVTYTPLSNAAERERVQIALVQADLNYSPGVTSERIGDWSEAFAQATANTGYQVERAAILASLAPVAAGIW